jgi:hypothetical protein
MCTSCNVPAVSFSGPKSSRTIPKGVEQTRSFQEYHHHHHHLHGLGFLKACSGFKISYKRCLKLNPINILKLFFPSSTWTSLVSSTLQDLINFQEYRFYKYCAARSTGTVDYQVEATLMQT